MSIRALAERVGGLTDIGEIQAILREMKVNPADAIAQLRAEGVSFSKVGLEAGLEARGYGLTGRVTLYTVTDSQALVRASLAEYVKFLDYCPVISPHRSRGLLQFTIVPYSKPKSFEKPECTSEAIAPEELWRLVEGVKSVAAQKRSLAAVKDASAYNDELAVTGNDSSMVIDYVSETPTTGRALDLGCGPGLNAERLLQKGWTVTAVDHHSKAIDASRKRLGKDSAKLTLKGMDITRDEFGKESYELVICAEVLQYISPLQLRSVLEKIHAALVPNGTFIGTFYFSSAGSEIFAEFSMSKVRVYFYPGSSTIPAILEASGFRLKTCSFKAARAKTPLDPTVPFCVEFIATKVSK